MRVLAALSALLVVAVAAVAASPVGLIFVIMKRLSNAVRILG